MENQAMSELVAEQAVENAQLKYNLKLANKKIAELQAQVNEQSTGTETEEG